MVFLIFSIVGEGEELCVVCVFIFSDLGVVDSSSVEASSSSSSSSSVDLVEP